MTKQEELLEGIKRRVDFYTKEVLADEIFKYLHSQGVVIKVKRSHDSDCSVHNMPAYPNGPCDCVELPAGCVAVEPLI
ncbi:hypothetical protein LCGC14_2667800 [marine sediment metagenome]|uniref:Uncharacterized protein n=1 Tax=marine sediment metagenome TaxID=412755 RepID=A0A0F9CGX9_9ZZZZ